MKAHIQIPKGWRRVTKGKKVEGDRKLEKMEWVPVLSPGWPVGNDLIIIRRVAAKGAKK